MRPDDQPSSRAQIAIRAIAVQGLPYRPLRRTIRPRHVEVDATANRLARGPAVSLLQAMAKARLIEHPPGEHTPGGHTPGGHTPGEVARQEARQARAARLAAALKSNLRRRKIQARERAADADESGHPAGSAGDQSTSSVVSPLAGESEPRQEPSG
jgi:hypothetical protein